MPKKTKKEKLIRSLRRRVAVLEKSSPSTPIYSTETKKELKKEKSERKISTAVKKPSITTKYSIDENKTKLIKKDLLKTFFLSIVAIMLELVLYFVGTRG